MCVSWYHPFSQFSTDPQYSIPTTLFFVLMYGFVFRLKYYYVWYMSDSINNLCGLGFSGYDEKGMAKWDLISNVNMLKVELPSNFRAISIYWNSCSSIWLRRLVLHPHTLTPLTSTLPPSTSHTHTHTGYATRE